MFYVCILSGEGKIYVSSKEKNIQHLKQNARGEHSNRL